MNGRLQIAFLGGLILLAMGCNSSSPEPASVEISSVGVRLTIVSTATDLFLQRFNLTMNVRGAGGCSSTTELFPDTGYAGRRNVYLAADGQIYVVGQYDARIIDAHTCQTSLSEFRHLNRYVVFIGSFDRDTTKHWTYFPAAQRPELPFEKR